MKNLRIAYICDGHASCSLEPTCFFRGDPVAASDVVCRHTFDPEHAVNGALDEFAVQKLDRFVWVPCDDPDHVTIYEKLPEEEL